MIAILLLLLGPASPASGRATTGCSNHVTDGSFEQGGAWTESSDNGLPVICTPGTCGTGGGTVGPRSGITWAWMGGISGVAENASVTEDVMIPVGTAELDFFLWIGKSSGNGQDRIQASLDGANYVTIHEGDPGYTGGYAEVAVDVSDKADGGSHSLTLKATTTGNGVTNFSVDDVSLIQCPGPAPAISIDDIVVTEAEATVAATFTVSIPVAVPTADVVVDYATGPASSGVPATPGVDYTPAAGTLTIPSGSLSATVTVNVLGDTLDEPPETFAVNLSNPVNATLGDAHGECTIDDNDAAPTLSVADLTITEGDSGTKNALFHVSLSTATGLDVTVAYATADGTAMAGSDYTATAGTLTLPAGSTSATIPVPILGDVDDELDETFLMNLTLPVNATLADGQGQATIADDDGPAISIEDTSVVEGNTGSVNAVFTVRLSGVSIQTVSVDYQASDGTAVDGSDYNAVSGTLTFSQGVTMRTLTVPVLGDTADEPDETFHVLLSTPVHGSLGDAVGIGKILDDDGGAIPLQGDLVHGSLRWADLGALPGPAPDQDIYLLERPPHSSFEVVVDGISGDVGSGSGPLLDRLDASMTVVQNSAPLGTGSSRSLRVQNLQDVPVTDYIRVRSAGCSTDCDPADVYRIRAWETTGSIARFNNTGTQTTLLVLANPSPQTITGVVWFRDSAGTLVGSSPFSLLGHRSLVLNTTTVPGVAGQTGTATVSNDGPYGVLGGKSVSVEPSTGLTFDTPLVPRPR
jgi:hypothetical protein